MTHCDSDSPCCCFVFLPSTRPFCNNFHSLITHCMLCPCFLLSLLSLQPTPCTEQVSYSAFFCHWLLYNLYCILSQLSLSSFFLDTFYIWNKVCMIVSSNEVIWYCKQPIDSFVANIPVKEVGYLTYLVLSRKKKSVEAIVTLSKYLPDTF